MGSTVYLLHRKPQIGLPVPEGSFDTPDAAIEHMARLVSARTGTGQWAVLAPPSASDGRDVLLRRTDGTLEAFFISEHHSQAAVIA
jgi:hypothetical protein